MFGAFFRSPRLTILLIGLIVVAGLGALQALPRQEDPTLARRFGSVTTFYPGATAERVESLVTEKLEAELQQLHEVKEIESLSRSGVSLITIELDDSYAEPDVDEIWSKVRDRLSDVSETLPPGVSPPEFEDRTTTAVTLLAALVWEEDGPAPMGLLSRLAEELENRLRNVPNTKETEIFGEGEEEVRITVDAAALASVGLTAADVSQAIARADSKMPAGKLRSDANDLLLEVEGELVSIDRIRRIPLRQQADGHSLRLGDIARVEKTVQQPAATEAWIGGRRGIGVGATMEPYHRIDLWAAQAQSVLDGFRSDVPDGVAFEVIFDQSAYTHERLTNLLWNLTGSATIVVTVLFLIMGVRSALIVAIALPLTMAATLAELNAFGVPLHQTSITGLIVAIGILIDNAIIAVDELNAQLRKGLSALDAFQRTGRLLARPLLASTATTVLAFLPIMLMEGGAGEFVGPIAIGVILSVSTSFLLALTIVPALAAFFAPSREDLERMDWRHHGVSSARVTGWYVRTLDAAFRRPALGIGASLVLPFLGFLVGRTLPEQFFPANDRNQFQIQLVLPPQASLAETRANVLRARALLHAHEEVTTSHWFLGEGTPRVFYNMLGNQDGVASYAGAFVTTRSAEATEALLPRLQAELMEQLPNARVVALPFEQGPPFDAPIEARLVGPDLDVLRRLGDDVRIVLSETKGVTFTTAKLVGGEPKLMLAADESAARLTGLRLADIAQQLNERLEGAVGGSLLEANEEVPVRVRVAGEDRATPDRITAERILSTATSGGSTSEPALNDAALPGVPLAALARVEVVPELAGITRRNGERINTVQAFLTPYTLISESLRDFRSRLDDSDFSLPAGYRLEFGGEGELRDEALGKLLAFALPLFVLMGGIIVLTFDSFRMAGLIFGVAFLAVGLGQLGVWGFGYPMGFVAIVGTMGLVGVAINDSIVVLSALREDTRARSGDIEATTEVVLDATRHVVATTLTTMGGFLPLILFGGRFWPPLAAAIAVGVAGSTLVALYLVPAAHVWMQRRHRPRVTSPAPVSAPGGATPAAATAGR